MSTTLLVNFVYCPQIGHVVEALHHANGYRAADPARRVAVTLNKNSATELADHVSFVEHVHAVPVDVFDGAADHARTLATLPPDWDVVVSDFRGHDPAQRGLFPGLASWFDASTAYFTGQKGFAGFPKPVPYSPGRTDPSTRQCAPNQPHTRGLPCRHRGQAPGARGCRRPGRVMWLPG